MHLTSTAQGRSGIEQVAREKTVPCGAKLAQPAGFFSGLKVPAGCWLFVSGRGARNAADAIVGNGETYAQTHRSWKRSKPSLEEAAGATVDDIVKGTVWVMDVGYFQAIHGVRTRRAHGWK
jgi:enamine deaminase RidA (YjgF/YER057c/UK114 family)